MEANYVMNAPVEDIIFENRNKEYGAYDIRRKYNRNVGIATAIAVSFLLLALFGPIIIKKLMPKEEEVVVAENKKATVTTLGPPPDITTPPPPPVDIPPPPKQIQFTVPDVVQREVETPPPPSQTEQQQNNTGSTTEEGPVTEAPPPPGGDPIQEETPKPPENFEFVSDPPAFKGDLASFFRDKIKYPDLAFETRVEGTVYVKFIVTPDGGVDPSTVQIAKGLKNGGAGLNDEALRVAKLLPDKSFKPGSNNGTPVRVWVTIPVRFQIGDQ